MRHAQPRRELVLRLGVRDRQVQLRVARCRTERRERAVDHAGQRREHRVGIPVVPAQPQVDHQVAVVQPVLDVRRTEHRIDVPDVGEDVAVQRRTTVAQVDPVPLHPDLAAMHAVELRVEIHADPVSTFVLLIEKPTEPRHRGIDAPLSEHRIGSGP